MGRLLISFEKWIWALISLVKPVTQEAVIDFVIDAMKHTGILAENYECLFELERPKLSKMEHFSKCG